ncbi:hypothetical protein [Terrabacter sp. Root181]|uniref:hypothetical protein n=1 Tax=Terrabacter sp. Root181 TaxID=1736484 RepID=UPI0006FBBF07|nr:hypothetical protein [Terrabacter sp. Root181]KRB45061.1 hypothetical protein ASD90_15335 [Terrabacter sp. Root181]
MRPLTASDPVGTHVLYVGRADPTASVDVDRDAGRGLEENHPGTVTAVDEQHGVRIAFLGLEHEPMAERRFRADDTGVFPGLVAVGLDDWEAARSIGWWAGLCRDAREAG